MNRSQYLDLYLSESHEHLGSLNRALLALEQGAGARAVEEAFRAAHTIKGMSATMGYGSVSTLAHDVESLLHQVRSGARGVDATLIDELLAGADTLERGIAAAAETGAETGAETETETGQSGPLARQRRPVSAFPVRVRPGTRYVRIDIAPTEQMKIARALIMTRALVQKGVAIRSEPKQFPEDFSGSFAIVLKPNGDDSVVADYLSLLPEVAAFSIETASAPSSEVEQDAAAAQAAVAKTSFLRVEQRRLDDLAESLGEIGVLQSSIEVLARAQNGALSEMVTRMSRLMAELQHTVLAMRMVPVGDVFDRFPRMMRDAARTLSKQVDFKIEGREIQIDRAIIEDMADPLMHLLRNAVDHGVETPAERASSGKPEKACIQLHASRDRSSVRIQIIDDGHGINVEKVVAKARRINVPVPAGEITSDELLRILAHPGFSTAEEVTDVSGRGVGLDAVVTRVRALGGAIDMQTRAGEGTTFTLRLPVTLAIAQALRVRIGEEDYAIPLTHVAEALELGSLRIEIRQGREVVRVRDEELPLIRLRHVLNTPSTGTETAAVVAELGDRRTALAVDRVIGREQILVKHFDSALGTLPIFSGVTLLPDGRPALVLDPISVV